MDNLDVPFHQLLNIKRESDNSDYMLMIEERPEYLNHVGTVHACVQVTLAEATSGEYLANSIENVATAYLPVVRKSINKYHRPANGKLFSKARILEITFDDVKAQVAEKGRSMFQLEVKIFDENNKNTLTSVFDWFIAKK